MILRIIRKNIIQHQVLSLLSVSQIMVDEEWKNFPVRIFRLNALRVHIV